MTDYLIPILTARHHELRKTISPNGVKGYDNEYEFTTTYEVANDIDELYKILVDLEGKAKSCVIRGSKSESAPEWHNRCYVSRTKTNHIEDIEQDWLMVDYDLPVSVSEEEVSDDDLPQYVLTTYLPQVLHKADYIFQHSATAKVKGKRGKGHYWFLIDDYIDNKTLKAWAELHDAIDGSLYQPVQIHYTATPKFIDIEDPIKIRTILVKQTERTISGKAITDEVKNYTKPNLTKTTTTLSSATYTPGTWRDEISKISPSNAHDHYKIAAGKFRHRHGKYADWNYFTAYTIQQMLKVGHDRASDYEGVANDIRDMTERYSDYSNEQNKPMNTDWQYCLDQMKEE